ncbi:hypothetical protein E5D57_012175 [Metarhizium anisopliae]|nr:hypothetical protein E5D57_012175 [Metarhizium anisopliae]
MANLDVTATRILLCFSVISEGLVVAKRGEYCPRQISVYEHKLLAETSAETTESWKEQGRRRGYLMLMNLAEEVNMLLHAQLQSYRRVSDTAFYSPKSSPRVLFRLLTEVVLADSSSSMIPVPLSCGV